MCDDLIALHYIHDCPSSKVHTSPGHPIPSPNVPTSASSSRVGNLVDLRVWHFTQHWPRGTYIPPGSEEGQQAEKTPVEHTWVVLPGDEAFEGFFGREGGLERRREFYKKLGFGEREREGAEMGEASKRKWTINVYSKNKSFLFPAPPLSRSKGFHLPLYATSINMLYEMSFSLPPPPVAAGTKHNTHPYILLPDDIPWFMETFPSHKRILDPGTTNRLERVFTLIPCHSNISNGQVERIGYLTLLPSSLPTSVSPQRTYISSLYIHPAYRSKGLGKFFLEEVHRYLALESKTIGEEAAREQQVWLTVFAENFAAVGLYVGLGYKLRRALWVVEGELEGEGEGGGGG